MRVSFREFMRRAGERASLLFPLAGQDHQGRVTGLQVDAGRLRLHEALNITEAVTGELALSGTSASVVLPAGARIIRIITTEDAFLRMGVGALTAGVPSVDGLSTYMPSGLVEYLLCPDPDVTYTLAAIKAGADDGIVYWSSVL